MTPPCQYKCNFHDQLKALFLPRTVPPQIVRESTLANIMQRNEIGFDAKLVARQSAIALCLYKPTIRRAVTTLGR